MGNRAELRRDWQGEACLFDCRDSYTSAWYSNHLHGVVYGEPGGWLSLGSPPTHPQPSPLPVPGSLPTRPVSHLVLLQVALMQYKKFLGLKESQESHI